MSSGFPIQWPPFRGWLSGSSVRYVEFACSTGHLASCFSLFARFRPACSLVFAALGCSMFGCSVALLPRCECCVLCFVVLTLRVRTSLAPRLAGFTVPARSTRDKSHGRTFLTWGSGQFFCPAWGAASFVGACRSDLSQVLTL